MMRRIWVILAVLLLAGSASATCDTEANCDSSCSGLFVVSYNDSWEQLDNSPYGNLCKPVGFENPLVMTEASCDSFVGIGVSGDCAENVNGTEDVVCPSYSNLNASVIAADCYVFVPGPDDYEPVAGNETALSTFDFTNEFFFGTTTTTTLAAPLIIGFASGAEAIGAVGPIIFGVVSLAGAIVAVVAAFAALTLVTHTVKALSGPLTKGLE